MRCVQRNFRISERAYIKNIGELNYEYLNYRYSDYFSDIWSTSVKLLPDAFAIALVNYFVAISLARLMASFHGYKVDPDTELRAFGIANIAQCGKRTHLIGHSSIWAGDRILSE